MTQVQHDFMEDDPGGAIWGPLSLLPSNECGVLCGDGKSAPGPFLGRSGVNERGRSGGSGAWGARCVRGQGRGSGG
jgi:hypothetical protein